MISIQTNVDSLVAQQNLGLDNQFQSNTIQQLTSGYRINKSGDDAAGLAVANGINSQIAQLTQGVNNANNGLSQLQIVDGGLSNISTILNRLQTLATESASNTFTGSRVTRIRNIPACCRKSRARLTTSTCLKAAPLIPI
jgi:flagellin